jgi:solute carrier family 13 (sodium-dependent dicarboxylate transporter), member 2/3/5
MPRHIALTNPSAEVLASGSAVLAAALYLAATGLSHHSFVLLLFLACCACWASGRWNDLAIAMAGLAGLAALGAVDQASLMKWLGHDTVWLIVGAFVISGVLQATGVAEALAQRGLRRVRTVTGLFAAISLTVGATAFLIPSTSARAALCVPVFLALASAIRNQRIVRALALLFPTIVLLSAGASLTGAAAHVMALELAAGAKIPLEIGFLLWAVLAVPPTLAICAVAASLIYRMFLTAEDRSNAIELGGLDTKTVSPEGWRAIGLALLAIALWVSAAAHGLNMGVAAMIVAVIMTLPGVTGVGTKQAFRSVEWELILFMVVVLAMGGALAESGTIAWASSGISNTLMSDQAIAPSLVAAVLIAVAMVGHLIVTSRTARVAVVLPATAFPAIALGMDPVAAVMAVALGTGFCQTMTASAKPVAVFSALDAPSFSAADLLKLSAALAAPFALILWACVVFYWPLVLEL